MEEKGQPHLKIFKMQCLVGEFVTEATGSSKKDAKRHAAELMLAKLKGLPPVPAKVILTTANRYSFVEGAPVHENRRPNKLPVPIQIHWIEKLKSPIKITDFELMTYT